MKKIIIERSKWFVGDPYSSCLLGSESATGRDDSKMCCLGFLGEACGISKDSMYKRSLPKHTLSWELTIWPEELFTPCNDAYADITAIGKYYYNSWQEVLAAINDADISDNDIRESWIKEGFKILLGYEVEFVGDYIC